ALRSWATTAFQRAVSLSFSVDCTADIAFIMHPLSPRTPAGGYPDLAIKLQSVRAVFFTLRRPRGQVHVKFHRRGADNVSDSRIPNNVSAITNPSLTRFGGPLKKSVLLAIALLCLSVPSFAQTQSGPRTGGYI